jgi:hypothetical protein
MVLENVPPCLQIIKEIFLFLCLRSGVTGSLSSLTKVGLPSLPSEEEWRRVVQDLGAFREEKCEDWSPSFYSVSVLRKVFFFFFLTSNWS